MMQPMDPDNPFAIVPQAPMTTGVPNVQIPAAKRGGMFGGGSKIGKILQSFLVNMSAGQGNPAAIAFLQQRQAQQEAEQRRQQEEQDYSRKRSDGWQDWVQRKQWELANPSPQTNDTVADYQFITQSLGPDAARRFLETKTNPIVMTPYGPMPYSAVAQPTKPVGRITPIDDGGPTAPPSGGFR